MTQEDKELLLKDLCARLPYGTLVYAQNADNWYDDEISTQVLSDVINEDYVVKPYLFPLSSMTESQNDSWRDAFMNDLAMSASINYPESEKYLAVSHAKSLEWLYKNHFDVSGLIEKGLAIDATGLNIY